MSSLLWNLAWHCCCGHPLVLTHRHSSTSLRKHWMQHPVGMQGCKQNGHLVSWLIVVCRCRKGIPAQDQQTTRRADKVPCMDAGGTHSSHNLKWQSNTSPRSFHPLGLSNPLPLRAQSQHRSVNKVSGTRDCQQTVTHQIPSRNEQASKQD